MFSYNLQHPANLNPTTQINEVLSFEFQLMSSFDSRIMCQNVAFGRKGLSIILRFLKLAQASFRSYKKITRKQIEIHTAIS